jgi:hypothetical protein
MNILAIIKAFLVLPEQINKILEKVSSLESAWQDYRNAKWVQDSVHVKDKLEKAANMDEVRKALVDLRNLHDRI